MSPARSSVSCEWQDANKRKGTGLKDGGEGMPPTSFQRGEHARKEKRKERPVV
jgi:hypothetical protein